MGGEIIVKDVMDYGVTTVLATMFLWLIVLYVRDIHPASQRHNVLLEQLCQNDERHDKLIENNTRATENMAEALKVINATFQMSNETVREVKQSLEMHDQRAQHLENTVTIIKERVSK